MGCVVLIVIALLAAGAGVSGQWGLAIILLLLAIPVSGMTAAKRKK